MVRVVQGVPNRYILEQTTVYYENIVRLGPHLSSLSAHAPHPSTPRLGFAVWEEVICHVFDPNSRHSFRNILLVGFSFWFFHIGIKAASLNHQVCCPAEVMSNG